MDHDKHSISTPDYCVCSRSVAAEPPNSTDGVHARPARSLTHARKLCATALMFAFVRPAHAAERFTKLSGAQIAARLGGMQFTEEVRRRDIYQKDGTLRRYEMGRARLGTWHIRGNEMCVDFGNDDDTNCFEIWLQGNKVVMQRDTEDNYPSEGTLEKPIDATPAVADGRP
jgi:hypothetical protein